MNWQLEALLAFLAFTMCIAVLSMALSDSTPNALHKVDELFAVGQAHECSSVANFAFAYSAGFASFPSFCSADGNIVRSSHAGAERSTLLLNGLVSRFQNNEWVLVLDANAHYK
ncbi:MAG: hypothetical protein V1847_00080 [Candidatus Diapherotrites archaeon]